MAEHSRFIANAEITPQEAMCALGERLGQLQFKWDPKSALLSQYPLLPPPPQFCFVNPWFELEHKEG